MSRRSRRARRLHRQMRKIERATIDYDDPAAEAAYYARATPVIEAVIALPGRRGRRLQLRALAWCAAAWDFGLDRRPGAPLGERVLAALLAGLRKGQLRQGQPR